MLDFNMVGYLPISIGYPSNLDNKIEQCFSKRSPNKVTSLSHSNSPSYCYNSSTKSINLNQLYQIRRWTTTHPKITRLILFNKKELIKIIWLQEKSLQICKNSSQWKNSVNFYLKTNIA
jgi:hypothetical protein